MTLNYQEPSPKKTSPVTLAMLVFLPCALALYVVIYWFTVFANYDGRYLWVLWSGCAVTIMVGVASIIWIMVKRAKR